MSRYLLCVSPARFDGGLRPEENEDCGSRAGSPFRSFRHSRSPAGHHRARHRQLVRPSYHGRAAADGEIYDMETMVAAHRTLPFQTRVRVRNLSNDKTVDVRIIDRGPFVQGRIIDLSHAAAQQIELIGPGFAQVEVTVIADPANPEQALFAVQIGAFRDQANAERAEKNMIAAYGAAKAVLRAGDQPVWRILAGRETSPEAAEALAKRIRAEQHEPQAFVVRLDP